MYGALFAVLCSVRRIYRVELVVETNGGVYPRGIPYLTMSAPARTGSLSRGVAVRDSDAVLEPMVVQHASSSVLSRSFYVRYSEEDFDVNDTVVFQLEKVSVTGKRDVAAGRQHHTLHRTWLVRKLRSR